MNVTNPTKGIVRITVADNGPDDTPIETEYLFPAEGAIDVLNTHVARVLREHTELVPGGEA